MLTLNLSKIRTASERLEQVYEPQECAAEGDSFQIVAPARLAFDIFKDKDRFRLVGTVGTRLELTCSRCLEPFTWLVDSAFDLMYQPKGKSTDEGEREIGDGDFSSAFYENETIDLGELMREQFYLTVPMKPLCREDCQGLCVTCGVNLNRGSCGCRRSWEDPRLEALRALGTSKRES
jgi:uncharacterized protein